MFKKIISKIKDLISLVLKEKSDHLFVQFFRYMLVSGVALAADVSLTYSLTEFFKIYYLASSIIGNIVGLIINYILNVIWVFNNRKVKNKKVEFLIFVGTSLIGMVISQSGVWFFTEFFKFHYMISKGISIIFGYIVRFVLRKLLLF